MSIIDNFKALPKETKTLLSVGTILGLVVALPLFLYAILTGNFELRRKAASGEPTPTPAESPSPTPIVTSPSPSASGLPSPTPTAPSSSASPFCRPSDINKDGITDVVDYSLMVSDFFETSPTNPRSDVNADGIVDITDYSILVANFFNQTGSCQ